MGNAGCVKKLLDNMHTRFEISPEDGVTRCVHMHAYTQPPCTIIRHVIIFLQGQVA